MKNRDVIVLSLYTLGCPFAASGRHAIPQLGVPASWPGDDPSSCRCRLQPHLFPEAFTASGRPAHSLASLDSLIII